MKLRAVGSRGRHCVCRDGKESRWVGFVRDGEGSAFKMGFRGRVVLLWKRTPNKPKSSLSMSLSCAEAEIVQSKQHVLGRLVEVEGLTNRLGEDGKLAAKRHVAPASTPGGDNV